MLSVFFFLFFCCFFLLLLNKVKIWWVFYLFILFIWFFLALKGLKSLNTESFFNFNTLSIKQAIQQPICLWSSLELQHLKKKVTGLIENGIVHNSLLLEFRQRADVPSTQTPTFIRYFPVSINCKLCVLKILTKCINIKYKLWKTDTSLKKF